MINKQFQSFSFLAGGGNRGGSEKILKIQINISHRSAKTTFLRLPT